MFLLHMNISNYYCIKFTIKTQLCFRYISMTNANSVCGSCGGFRRTRPHNSFYLIGDQFNQRYYSSDTNNKNNQQNNKELITKKDRVDRYVIPVKHLEQLKQQMESRSTQQQPIEAKWRPKGFFSKLILKKPYELMEWYAKTPPKRRMNYYISAGINVYFYISVFAIGLLFLAMKHTDDHPITGRECTVTVNPHIAKKLENECIVEIVAAYEDKIVPSTDHRLKRLDNCFNKLMDANKDLDGIAGQHWVASLIDDPTRYDVIVAKDTATIIVFNKVIEMCDNDDQLAYVLAHNIAHALLDHKKEAVGLTPWYWSPLAVWLPNFYWTIETYPFIKDDPTEQAFIRFWKRVLNRMLTVSVIPYKEVYEQEADRIGLQLLTRACFDIRESPKFCAKNLQFSTSLKDSVKKSSNKEDNKNYFYMHPIDEKRIDYLDALMQPFIDIRHEMTNCGKLC